MIVRVIKRGFPTPYGTFDHTLVLTKGEIDDYAAYEGHGSPEWVELHGDKLSERLAVAYFPEIEGKAYRL